MSSGSHQSLLTSQHGSDGAAALPCRTNTLHKESLCGAMSHIGVRDRRAKGGIDGLREKEIGKTNVCESQMIKDGGR